MSQAFFRICTLIISEAAPQTKLMKGMVLLFKDPGKSDYSSKVPSRTTASCRKHPMISIVEIRAQRAISEPLPIF
jgi:hypothetical protein